jgi:uncharacterized protein DUF6364
MVISMTAKVTLSFADDTIADARRFAQRDGMSLSAWVDQAAREKALRELFGAHAAAVRRAGFDEAAALADEHEIEMIDAAMFGQRYKGGGPAGLGGGSGTAGPGAA